MAPNQPSTPLHNFRCDQDLWDAALRISADRGETVTDVLVRALTRYVREFGED